MTFKNTDKVLATSSQGGTRIRRVKHVSIGTGQNKQRENEKYNNKTLSQTFENPSPFPLLFPFTSTRMLHIHVEVFLSSLEPSLEPSPKHCRSLPKTLFPSHYIDYNSPRRK